MGIGDWFKRFKRNAAEYEQYREGTAGAGTESQAARAAHERQTAAEPPTPATEDRSDAGGESGVA